MIYEAVLTDLPFSKIVHSTVDVDVKFVDSQGGLDPEKGTDGVTSLSVSVIGKYSLKIGEFSVKDITFDPLIFTGNVPSSLHDLGKSLAQFLKDSAET